MKFYFMNFIVEYMRKYLRNIQFGFIEKKQEEIEKNKENARNYGKIGFNTYLNKYDDQVF